MSTQTIDMDNVETAYFNSNMVSRMYLNGTKIWPRKQYYLTFESDYPFALATYNGSRNWNGIIEISYSAKPNDWGEFTGAIEYVTTQQDDGKYRMYLRGTGNSHIVSSATDNQRFVFDDYYNTGNPPIIDCYGNIETLLDYSTVKNGGHPSIDQYCFYSLFNSCSSLRTPPSIGCTTLNGACFYRMFYNSGIQYLPALYATTLTQIGFPQKGCYQEMFKGCYGISLTTYYDSVGQPYSYQIPYTGTGSAASYSLRDMFANTGGSSIGTPTIQPSSIW